MTTVAILGGGIAGLSAAYELELQRRSGRNIDWHLFEASSRLGGTVSTTRLQGAHGEYILEDGPDGWVTEKPWARQLAEELGLGDQVIACNESEKRTYLWLDRELIALPERMRLMVPEDLHALRESKFFSEAAKAAYAAERDSARELRSAIPPRDESVADFVRRHFGAEVLAKVAAPLLSGVFGGDVERLSVRAVMPAFVAMEAEHGSLVAALEARARQRGERAPQPTFTTLRRGMGTLAEALVAALPAERLHTRVAANALQRRAPGDWLVRFTGADAASCAIGYVPYDRVVIATPVDVARRLLLSIHSEAAALIPAEASSALLVTLCWPAGAAAALALPPGFGFLVPPDPAHRMHLLAATFADQKYPGRAPQGCRIVRAFFGSGGAERMAGYTDSEAAASALAELGTILGPLPAPDPALTTVRRWPRSLPQYEVEHLDRMTKLQHLVQELGGLWLLGNGYHGVGVPDLVRDARAAARNLGESLSI